MTNSSSPKNTKPLPELAVIAIGRDHLTTEEAARTLNRKSQTLRKWACLGNGPIRPIRINGRLLWRVADLAILLAGAPVDGGLQ